MNTVNTSLTLDWFTAGTTAFEHIFTRVGRAVAFAGGTLIPDGEHLTLIERNGVPRWKHLVSSGVWGHPVVLGSNSVLCADLISSLHIINTQGEAVGIVELPAPPNTDITSDNQGTAFLGIGTRRCDVLCIDTEGKIRWQKTLAEDDGLTHPLTLDPVGRLWVPTDTGLFVIDRDTSAVTAKFGVERQWRCISNVLCQESDALVVVAHPSGQCHLMHISRSGGEIAEALLPSLRRARLFASINNQAWLIGSTSSDCDPVEQTDRVLVFSIDSQGRPGTPVSLPGDRSIDGTPDQSGALWAATYTRDESEQGALYLISREGKLLVQWSSTPPAGVGAPLLFSGDMLQVPTSRGLACLRFSKSSSS
jgi:hypothetical protein